MKGFTMSEVDEAISRAFREFMSPYGMGAALEGLPSHGALSFGGPEQGVYVLDALTRTVQANLEEYDGATGDERALALGRVQLFWMMLKGFIYSAVSAGEGQGLISVLAQHPDVVGRAKEVLSEGFDLISTTGEVATPAWRQGEHGALMLPTVELIAELETAIKQALEYESKRRGWLS